MTPGTQMPDPPVPLTAKTVVRTNFAQTRRGFDPDEVTAHLHRVADHVADLESTIADLQRRLREQDRTPDDEQARAQAYQTSASRIAELMRTFDQDMQRLRAQQEAEVERTLQEARANAERIRQETEQSRAEAERILEDARQQAARHRDDAERSTQEALGSLQARRAALLDNLRQIRETLRRSSESVDAFLAQGEPDTVVIQDLPEPMPSSHGSQGDMAPPDWAR